MRTPGRNGLRWIPLTALLAVVATGANAGINYKPAAKAEELVPTGGEKAQADASTLVSGENVAAQPSTPEAVDVSAVSSSAGGSAPLMRNLITSDLSQIRWERTIGGDRTDRFNDVVVRRSDLAVIAAGGSMSRSAGRQDAWIVAVDSAGTPLWERNFGGALDEEFKTVIDLDDGSVVAAGYGATGTKGGGAGIAIGLGANGTEKWRYSYDSDFQDQLTAVAPLASGDIVLAGSSGSTTGVLARLTPEGEAVWENTYSSDFPQVTTSVGSFPNGDLIVLGESTALFDSDAAITRLSSSGEVLWHKTWGSDGNDRLWDMVLLRDGDFLAVGETERDGHMEGWLSRWSPEGELRWEKVLGGPGRDALYSIAMRANFTIVAAGIQNADDRSRPNAWLVEVADDGSVTQSQSFGGELSEDFAALSPRADGSLVVAGQRQATMDTPASGYTATIGAPIKQVVMRNSGGQQLNPPVVFLPGEGKIVTESSSVEILGNVIHNRPIAQLFVDGSPAKLLHNGAFTARVSVSMGTTRVKVEAIDNSGVAGAADMMVTRVADGRLDTAANLAAIKESVAFGNYHAVVIGNNTYSGDLPVLETAEQDAQAVADTLRDDFGFNVKLLLNASHDDIVSTLEEKSEALREDDNLLIYYAGHGYYDEDVDLGYWLPVDASLNSKDNWIRNSTVTDSIKSMKAKHVMLVADSCFSGTLLRSVNSKRTGRFYEEMASRTARLVMTSGGVEPVMDGGGDGHSVFARNFLNKLRSGEEIIDGTSLYQAIREPVVLSSQQVPQYANIRFIQSDGGDFLFVRKGV